MDTDHCILPEKIKAFLFVIEIIYMPSSKKVGNKEIGKRGGKYILSFGIY